MMHERIQNMSGLELDQELTRLNDMQRSAQRALDMIAENQRRCRHRGRLATEHFGTPQYDRASVTCACARTWDMSIGMPCPHRRSEVLGGRWLRMAPTNDQERVEECGLGCGTIREFVVNDEEIIHQQERSSEMMAPTTYTPWRTVAGCTHVDDLANLEVYPDGSRFVRCNACCETFMFTVHHRDYNGDTYTDRRVATNADRDQYLGQLSARLRASVLMDRDIRHLKRPKLSPLEAWNS